MTIAIEDGFSTQPISRLSRSRLLPFLVNLSQTLLPIATSAVSLVIYTHGYTYKLVAFQASFMYR
jgi:hypothetical protein